MTTTLLANIGPDPINDLYFPLTAGAVVISALLAIGALIPAVRGHFRSTVFVTAPVFVLASFTTDMFFVKLDGLVGSAGSPSFFRAWALLVGIPVAVSSFALLVAWLRIRKQRSSPR
jgi:hypothetical protein